MRGTILSLAVMVMAASCCRLEPAGIGQDECAALQVNVSTSAAVTSKGIISGQTLDSGSSIGLSMYDISGSAYQGRPCENRCYTASGSGSKQTWNPDDPIMVSNTPGTLYGYYPYSSSVTVISDIPVRADSDSQIDWMYAVPVPEVTKSSSKADLVMRHALSAVRITAMRGTYTGTGVMSAVSVKGEKIATSAVLDARTGELTGRKGYGTAVAPQTGPVTLASATPTDIIVIPAEGKTDIEITMTIDGSEYALTLKDVSLEQGKITECEVTVNDGKVYLTSVALTAWTHDMAGSQIIQKDYKVTLGGDMDGLSFSNSIDQEGNVTILAVPYISGDAEARPVTIIGEATLSQSVDEATGILTVMLSDIRSDVTVEFAGIWLWVTVTHDVSDISAPTKIYANATSNSLERLKIDGIETDTDNSHQFETTGEHVMRVAFSDRRNIPNSFMYYIRTVTSAVFPEGVETIGSWAFLACDALRSVSFPSTLKSMDYQCFERSGLESVTVPAGCAMNYGIFSTCKSLRHARLPSDMKTIPNSTFYNCSALTDFVFPEGITAIEEAAFYGTGLESIHFPDAVSELSERVCGFCKDLKEVRLPANLRKIGKTALAYCQALERVILADGTVCTGELVIPEGVTEVCSMGVMIESPHFTSISIPSTLTLIQPRGLCYTTVEGFSIPNGNAVYDIRNHSVVETVTGMLVASSKNSSPVHESVTVIGRHAFYESVLSTIDLPAGLAEIQPEAFQYADLKTVICRAPVPPTTGSNSFQVQKYNGTLKVPAESLEAYRSQWMVDEEGQLGAAYLKWKIEALAEGE